MDQFFTADIESNGGKKDVVTVHPPPLLLRAQYWTPRHLLAMMVGGNLWVHAQLAARTIAPDRTALTG